MSLSNRDRVGRALDLLNEGLKPFVVREMEAAYGTRWRYQASDSLRDQHFTSDGQDLNLDVQALFFIMWDQWDRVFKKTLGHAERNYVSELRETRNTWAHQGPFSSQDAHRALDTIARLLRAVSATEQEDEVERQRLELQRIIYEEQARNITRRTTTNVPEGQLPRGLLPWREVIVPHPDVASGNFQYAEFAADLSQVYRGIASEEYSDTYAFFRRTFLTHGLRQLLLGALRRLSRTGGDPIVELQTNFGGGKTHSLLSLYHLFSGVPASDLVGIEPLLQEAQLQQAPLVQRAVLVGHALSPARVEKKPDGCEIHTMWGELAWQLLKKEGYDMVAEDDRQGVSPGSERLRQLFVAAGPSLILIDEWVVFARQLYDKHNLPAGSFEANLSFAQNLTEAAKATPNTLVVATIPASVTEKGGEGGEEAAARLQQIFGRVESPWRPADTEEGFEIVRRRLFESIPSHLYPSRDATAHTFSEFYRSQRQEFPDACSEASYEERIRRAYPIHPELFDRLFTDWSSIDKFQRTRGVLSLMAAVIHQLWVQQDRSLLIMPAHIPLDAAPVQSKFMQYLADNWVPIIEKDVDGSQSLSRDLDSKNANFGRYGAAQRVARTIFFGSVPTLQTANKGIQDVHIKLGCAQPQESVGTFGDALRRLTEQATYLYQHDRRYWYDTHASVTRLAQDRATQYNDEAVYLTIKEYLKPEQRQKGDFASVHLCPESGADILDENNGLRLVLLRPQFPHARRDWNSPASGEVQRLLSQRGSGPRTFRNTLIFLAPDRTRVEELKQAVRLFLAWDSIDREHESLNLDAFQRNQARTRRNDAEERIIALIPEAYCLLIVPEQPDPRKPEYLQDYKLSPQRGQGLLGSIVSNYLRTEELLITRFAGLRLRQELDRIPLWRGDHVSVKELVENFARYIYLPRLKHPDVLLEAIRDGVQSPSWQKDTFAYASGYDGEQKRYQNLQVGSPINSLDIATDRLSGSSSQTNRAPINIVVDGQSLLVKSAVAEVQLLEEEREQEERRCKDEEERRKREEAASGQYSTGGTSFQPPAGGISEPPGGSYQPVTPLHPSGGDAHEDAQPHRFYGSVQINERMMASEAGKIMEEVVKHLTSLSGARVKVTLEIEAEIPDGAPTQTVRVVKENSNTLRFQSSEFHER